MIQKPVFANGETLTADKLNALVDYVEHCMTVAQQEAERAREASADAADSVRVVRAMSLGADVAQLGE